MKFTSTGKFDFFNIVNTMIMLAIIFITLYPMYNIFIISISGSFHVMRGDVTFYPKQINFDAYKLVFKRQDFLQAYINTLIYTITGVIIQLLCTVLCAYPLSRQDFFGRRFFNFFIIFTMFVSGGMIPMYLLIYNLKLLNSIWAIVLPPAISTYNMLIMRTSFSGIPQSLTESAYMDGANDVYILRRIIIPLSKPVISTMVLFYSVGHWNGFFPAMIYLRDESKYPVQLLLRSILIQGNVGVDTSNSMLIDSLAVAVNFKYAMIIITVVPILCVYPFIQKYFTKGVMIGAIKG